MTNPQDQLQKNLPFDQFSRQKIVSFLIDEGIRDFVTKKTLKIIDLGGHKGQTSQFQNKDDVTILDVYDESYDGYIKGDATNMELSDSSFDVACSFDVLEHIPRHKRQAFINEALRVSKYGLFIAMPLDTSGKVSSAEKLLNKFHKIIFNDDHRWLKEHIDYKIPTAQEIDKLVVASGATSTRLYSNQIGDWQLMQMLIFSAAQNPEITTYVNKINSWYNLHTLELDGAVDVGYRGIYFISKDQTYVTAVDRAIKNLRNNNISNQAHITVNRKTFYKFAETTALISKRYTDLFKKYSQLDQSRRTLVEENLLLQSRLEELHLHNEKLTKDISAIYSSKSWKITRPIRMVRYYANRKKKN